jgi:hypothetical protein
MDGYCYQGVHISDPKDIRLPGFVVVEEENEDDEDDSG